MNIYELHGSKCFPCINSHSNPVGWPWGRYYFTPILYIEIETERLSDLLEVLQPVSSKCGIWTQEGLAVSEPLCYTASGLWQPYVIF